MVLDRVYLLPFHCPQPSSDDYPTTRLTFLVCAASRLTYHFHTTLNFNHHGLVSACLFNSFPHCSRWTTTSLQSSTRCLFMHKDTPCRRFSQEPDETGAHTFHRPCCSAMMPALHKLPCNSDILGRRLNSYPSPCC